MLTPHGLCGESRKVSNWCVGVLIVFLLMNLLSDTRTLGFFFLFFFTGTAHVPIVARVIYNLKVFCVTMAIPQIPPVKNGPRIIPMLP